MVLDSWRSQSRAGEQGWGKVAPPQRMAALPSRVGAAADLQFNNGNMHFTNERINSREMVFLATVALCFKGVGFI